MRAFGLVWCAGVILLCSAGSAAAHDVGGTSVFLDIGDNTVGVELQLPAEQLAMALSGEPSGVPAGPGGPALPAESIVAAYLAEHISATGRDGRPFVTTVESVHTATLADGEHVVGRLTLRAPAGGSARWLRFHNDVIVHRVVSHSLFVFVRHDLRSGMVGHELEALGLMHYQNVEIVIDRGSGTVWRGFTAVFRMGMGHIAEGTDHLMFLFLLLAVAPQVARNRRWHDAGNVRRSLRETVKIVSAFTLGHSITLIAVALAGIRLHAQPVEAVIALSIFITALHALRPLFAGREVVVAGSFGLIHGMAFATALAELGLSGGNLVLAVAGFNLGVEAMQLAIVALTMPWLVAWSRSRSYSMLRVASGVIGAVAAAGWFVERLWGLHTPIPALVEAMVAYPAELYVALAVSAAAAVLVSRCRLGLAARSRAT